MRGARFLSFMLVLLSPFGALTASQAAAAPMAGPASEKLPALSPLQIPARPKHRRVSSAALRSSIPSPLRPAKKRSAKRSTATRPAPSPRGGSRRS